MQQLISIRGVVAAVCVVVSTIVSCSPQNPPIIAASQEYHEVIRFGEREDRVFWSPDGARIATISGELSGRVAVWDSTSGDRVVELEGSHVYAVAWNPDGDKIASNTENQELLIWNAETGRIAGSMPGWENPYVDLMMDVDWSPDGTLIASSANDVLLIWHYYAGQGLTPRYLHTDWIQTTRWSPDGTKLATVSSGDGVLAIWDSGTGEPLYVQEGHTTVEWSPDSSRVATVTDNKIVIWNVETEILLKQFEGHEGRILALSWNADGERLASVGADDVALIWDIVTETELFRIVGQKGDLNAVEWSPAGDKLATIGTDGKVRIWEQQPD